MILLQEIDTSEGSHIWVQTSTLFDQAVPGISLWKIWTVWASWEETSTFALKEISWINNKETGAENNEKGN